MITLIRTHPKNSHFITLVEKLNVYLKITDGQEHSFYNQYNHIAVLKHVVVAYVDNKAVGCGAFKTVNKTSAEIKRMYTAPLARKKGVASKVLVELEQWAKEIGYTNCILETGKRQIEAVNFYQKMNYTITSNYGPYKNMTNSICFKKTLS